MFAYTHIFYTKLVERAATVDSLIVLGSVLPDIALTGIIGWDDLHKKEMESNNFRKFVKTKYQSFVNFAADIQRHNELDYLSHQEYKGGKGFAYQFQTTDMVEFVGKACGVDRENAVLKAHNFLESAVEMMVLQDNIYLKSILKDFVEKADIAGLSIVLADYFTVNKHEVENKINEFLTLFMKYDLSKFNDWIPLWNELNHYFFNKDIDNEYAKKALKLSLEIVTPKYREFIDFAVRNTKYTL